VSKMKNLLGIVLMLTVGIAHADGYRHGHHGGFRNDFGGNWVGPMILGGVVTYALTRPVPPPPPPQVIYVPTGPGPVSYSATPPFGYHWEQVLDANCNCYRVVAVPN
jgi:hypothetical protein